MAVKAKLVDYFDVWNTADGFVVNNLCEVGTIELADLEDKTIISALRDFGYLNISVTTEDLTIEDLYPYMEIFEVQSGCPLGRLEIIENE